MPFHLANIIGTLLLSYKWWHATICYWWLRSHSLAIHYMVPFRQSYYKHLWTSIPLALITADQIILQNSILSLLINRCRLCHWNKRVMHSETIMDFCTALLWILNVACITHAHVNFHLSNCHSSTHSMHVDMYYFILMHTWKVSIPKSGKLS